MKRTPKIITLFNICFGIVFSFLWIELLFFNNSNNLFHPLKQLGFALVWVCILTVILLFFNLLPKKCISFGKKHFNGIMYSCMLCLFVLQLVFVYCTSTVIGWDCNNLITPALSEEIGSYNTYFSQYPHNLFLLLAFKVLGIIFKTACVSDMWLAYSIFNTLMVDVAILFLVKTAALLSSHKTACITLSVSILFLGFTPYLIVPYTDTLSMPFIIGSYYFFCQLYKGFQKGEWRLFPAICLPLLLLTGFLIKPTTIILLIAIFIIFLCWHFPVLFSEHPEQRISKADSSRPSGIAKRFNSSPRGAHPHGVLFCSRTQFPNAEQRISLARFSTTLTGYLIGCGLFVFIGFQGFHSYVDTLDMFDLDRNLSVPITHYLMMGTNIQETETGYNYGGFNMDDIGITMSQSNPADAKKANLTEYRRRMNAFGISGYLDFINKKARQVTSEGDFYWGDEGGFADWSQVGKNILTEFVYPNGTYYRLYTYMLQGIWILLFLGVAVSPFVQNKENGNELYTIARCAILGSLLFILIFEGRSRYLINYLPFYVLLFSRVCALIPHKHRK